MAAAASLRPNRTSPSPMARSGVTPNPNVGKPAAVQTPKQKPKP